MTATAPIKTILQELILDFQSVILKTGHKRRVRITSISGKATVCIGVRRAGKSTLLFQIMADLLGQDVSMQNILYINFFDDRLHGLQHTELGIILEAYFSLYPEKKNTEKIYCFFDEIQMIPKWEPFIERIMRAENCEVYITGSSANMLSKEIATQMRGRALSWEIFPFSFQEFLDLKNIASDSHLTSKNRLMIEKAFESFWEEGGFPEVLNLPSELRIKIHQEYFTTILFRDLIERHDIAHPKAVTDLAYYLIDNTAAHYSINSLLGYLKSLGHKLSKATVSQFLAWFEDAYMLFTVRIYDVSMSRSHANPKKIYCIDHSLIKSISSGILVNSGHLLENIVFIALRRIAPSIYYYKSKNGKEVDFIVQTKTLEKLLIQVSENMIDPNTRKREVTALNEAMGELKLSIGIIVTRDQSEQITVAHGEIKIIPIWYFLLYLNEWV